MRGDKHQGRWRLYLGSIVAGIAAGIVAYEIFARIPYSNELRQAPSHAALEAFQVGILVAMAAWWLTTGIVAGVRSQSTPKGGSTESGHHTTNP